MTPKQFYAWQTAGGTDDVMRLVDCLERADIQWCAIGGIAVNHWAAEPMVTQDVDLVVAAESIERAVKLLEDVGFTSEHKDLGDIGRLVESHPRLWELLETDLKEIIQKQ